MKTLFMLNEPKVEMRFSDVQKIIIPHREEKEFNVKGHKIMNRLSPLVYPA